jgi:hypothetical protein
MTILVAPFRAWLFVDGFAGPIPVVVELDPVVAAPGVEPDPLVAALGAALAAMPGDEVVFLLAATGALAGVAIARRGDAPGGVTSPDVPPATGSLELRRRGHPYLLPVYFSDYTVGPAAICLAFSARGGHGRPAPSSRKTWRDLPSMLGQAGGQS